MVAVKGSYLLVLYLDRDIRQLQIGRLGSFDFAAGYYLYVGSAFGSGGLAARLAYHLRRTKLHPHWHIDYLRTHAQLLEAWTVSGPERLECRWCARLAAMPVLHIPVRKFGASDSRCPAHLFYTPVRPCARFLSSVLLDDLPLINTTSVQELLIEVHLFNDA